MDRRTMSALARYHAWGNDRILTTAAGLSDEEFRRPGAFDHESAFHTIRHLLDADWSWREFLTGHDVGKTYVWDHGFVLDDLPSIHAFCTEEDARLVSYVGSLDDAALAQPLLIGPDEQRPRWFVLAHVVNHGTQHRSELARYFTDCGHSPGQLDLIDGPDPAAP
jgi:uncharacterized damage-inducible protein DinB